MALFTDGPPSSIEDLSAQDSQLLDVAATEGIDLTKKLALAHEQLGVEVEGLLGRMVPAASRNVWLRRPGIGNVVVTTPLRLWHTYRTLKLVYGDAYFNQSNDRYAQKRDEFEQQSKWAYEKMLEAGIGMTSDPMPQAATPSILAAAGLIPAGTYYVTSTWVNAAGEEGSPAIPASLSVSNQTFLVQPGNAPGNAAGWNIYAGVAPEQMVKQNGTPVAPAGTFLQAAAPATSGASPGQGQAAGYFFPIPRLIQRG